MVTLGRVVVAGARGSVTVGDVAVVDVEDVEDVVTVREVAAECVCPVVAGGFPVVGGGRWVVAVRDLVVVDRTLALSGGLTAGA